MASVNQPTTTDFLNVTLPTALGGYKANDIIIVFVYLSFPDDFDTSSAVVAPAGWIEIDQELIDMAATGNQGDRFAVFYYPVVTDGDTPLDLLFQWSSFAVGTARTVVFRNVDLSDPFILSQPIQVSVAGDPISIALQVTTLVDLATVVVAAGSRANVVNSLRMSFDVTTTYRSSALTNDALSADGGGFASYGSFPDIGIMGADPGTDFNIMSVANFSGSPPGVQSVVAGCDASLVVDPADQRGMGIIFALNQA